jgi:hypothetical protein
VAFPARSDWHRSSRGRTAGPELKSSVTLFLGLKKRNHHIEKSDLNIHVYML